MKVKLNIKIKSHRCFIWHRPSLYSPKHQEGNISKTETLPLAAVIVHLRSSPANITWSTRNR